MNSNEYVDFIANSNVESFQSCHDGRFSNLSLWAVFQELKDNFGRASERISSDRGKGIGQSNAREKEETLT